MCSDATTEAGTTLSKWYAQNIQQQQKKTACVRRNIYQNLSTKCILCKWRGERWRWQATYICRPPSTSVRKVRKKLKHSARPSLRIKIDRVSIIVTDNSRNYILARSSTKILCGVHWVHTKCWPNYHLPSLMLEQYDYKEEEEQQ